MEKVFTNTEHVKWLREQARLKRPYWYGTYYNECTETLLAKKSKQYPAHYTADRFARYSEDIKDGQICGDCVNGAIKGAIWSELGTRKPVYKSHDCPDKSADGMFEYCRKIGMEWGTIDSIPDVPGVAVRMSGHVGVYVGNGEVVEWRNFKYGCVVTKLKSRKWLHWYKLPWTDYVGEQDSQNTATLGAGLLKIGSRCSAVEELQKALLRLGYKLPQYGADGDFGEETEEALKEFQRDYELEVDGQYGSESHAALMAALADLGEAEDDEQPATRTVVVTGGSVYIRKGASTAYDIITVAHKGDRLPCTAIASNGWHCVIVNGKTGWISGKYSKVGC